MEGPPPKGDGTVLWWARNRVAGEVPCDLRFGVPSPEGEKKEGVRGVS